MTDPATPKPLTQQELQHAQHVVESHLDNSPLAIVEWGPDFRFLRWSRGAERIFGYTSTEMVGRAFDSLDPPLIFPDDMPKAMAHVDRLLSGRTSSDTIVARNVRKDGRVVHMQWSGSSLFDAAGKLVSVLSHGIDVTDRVTAEQKLADTLRRLELHLDNSPIAILEWSPDGTVTRVSSGLERMSGYSADELVGRSLAQMSVIHPEDVARARQRIGMMMTGEMKTGSATYRCLCKDGRVLHVKWSSSALFDDAGRVTSIFSHGVDITERVDAERALTAGRDAAEAANRAKDRFIASLSHELRTPLTPARALLSVLREDPRLPADVRDDIRLAHSNVMAESRLIDDLLDLTRLARGDVAVELKPVDAHVVIESAVNNASASTGGKTLHLHTSLSADRPVVVADSLRLGQVMSNLLNNSMKFTPAGGTIRVSTENRGNLLVIRVTDTGVGIAPEHLAHIFEPFERGETQYRYEYTGLGLGLAIARALLRRMNGTISASSEGSGKGASFELSLPLATAPAAPQTAPAGGSRTGNGDGAPSPARLNLSVLLVEDHPLAADLFARLLRGCGCKVSVARTAAQALDSVVAERFDLIISDIGLPDQSGHELLRQLRRNGITAPAIALSGYGMQQDITTSRDAGFLQHLTKPIDFQTLVTALRDATSGVDPTHAPPA